MPSETPPEVHSGQPTSDIVTSEQFRVYDKVALPLLLDLFRVGVVPEDHVRQVIDGLVQTKPWIILEHIELLLACSFAENIIEGASEKDPAGVLRQAGKFKRVAFGPRIIEKTARYLAICKDNNHGKGSDVFDAVEHFREEPWAEEVLILAVDNDGAWGAFNAAEKILDMAYAERILRKAAPLNTWASIRFLDNYKSAPFAESILMDIMGLSFQTEKQAKPAGTYSGPTLSLTTPNGTMLGYRELDVLTRLPFAERLFRRLAEKSPDILRNRPRLIDLTPWGSEIIRELGAA